MHRIVVHGLPAEPGESLEVGGEEAHHAARVRRVGVGDEVELLDLRGAVAIGRVRAVGKVGKRDGWSLNIGVESLRMAERIVPELSVWSEPPKGDDLTRMVDQLSQVGAAAWAPLVCVRSEVDPRPGKLDRARRAAIESAKQCGRAWGLEVGARVTYHEALGAGNAAGVVVAHASGEPYRASGINALRLLVGPVGDLTDDELGLAREAGAQVARFGPLVMRIDTACVGAAAIILDAEMRLRARNGHESGR